MSDFLRFIFPFAPESREKALAREILARVKGGEGSGNFGHAGRPGEVGGSAESNIGNVSINLSGVNSKRTDEILGAVNKLQKISPINLSEINTDARSSSIAALGATKNGYVLSVNKDFLNDPNYENEMSKSSDENWIYGKDIQDAIAHEYAHALMRQGSFSDVSSFSFSDAEKRYLIDNAVSRYGKTDYIESAAELFTKFIKEGEASISPTELKIVNKIRGIKEERKPFSPPKWLIG